MTHGKSGSRSIYKCRKSIHVHYKTSNTFVHSNLQLLVHKVSCIRRQLICWYRINLSEAIVTDRWSLKGKLHSKIIISDLVGFFCLEFDGESLRSKLEQEHSQTDGRKWPKNLR